MDMFGVPVATVRENGVVYITGIDKKEGDPIREPDLVTIEDWEFWESLKLLSQLGALLCMGWGSCCAWVGGGNLPHAPAPIPTNPKAPNPLDWFGCEGSLGHSIPNSQEETTG
ncbi:hypothetical protein COCOBI_pt-1490 (chloroplast) [Coccomyxa sp. Obi]|nr:hypothetical protein COCOBI_pt-1490 [Coccomyxa sp. Obi]